MAPISRFASPTLRMVAQRRGFSILPRVRGAIRAAEPHPFERYPTTVKAARPDYSRLVRKLGDSAMFFIPLMGTVLTWPLWVKPLLDGHIGDY